MLKNFQNHRYVKWGVKYLQDIFNSAIESNEQLKTQMLQFFPFLLASFLSGFMAFVYSKLFTFSEKLSFFIYEFNKALVFISTPFLFLLSWWLVERFANNAKGSGIPQVMASIEFARPTQRIYVKHFLSLKIIVIKIVASCAKVIGGGILGREGPTIQISSAIFNEINNRLPKWWPQVSQRNIIMAGAASGLAAAFNTPLGGIIFAIEELSKYPIKYYKYPLFIAIVIAGLTAQGFNGPYLYLGYPKTEFNGFWVYIGMVLTAITAGYLGAKMCVILMKFIRLVGKQKSVLNRGLWVLAASLVVATFIYFFGEDAMGSGKELMERLLFTKEKTTEWYMPFVRISGLVATFGSGGAGGVFAPSLSSGATIGALVSQVLDLHGNNANILVLVGMASFLTAVTRAPFTSAIIIFEMTDRHSIIFFLLLGTVIANLVATLVSRESFYSILKESYMDGVMQEEKNKP